MKGLVFAWMLGLSAIAHAETHYQLQSCVNAAGQPVATQDDPSAAQVVSVQLAHGKPVIVTNSTLLPQLDPTAREFLYARACVVASGGLWQKETREAASANDCAALAALQRSGLLAGEAERMALERNLGDADPEWRWLPGPPRQWGLRSCAVQADGGMPRLSNQAAWNHCVQSCGNVLWTCQHGALSAQGGCMERYERCAAMCDFHGE